MNKYFLLISLMLTGLAHANSPCRVIEQNVYIDETSTIEMSSEFASRIYLQHPNLMRGSSIRIPLNAKDQESAKLYAGMLVKVIKALADRTPLTLDVIVKSGVFCNRFEEKKTSAIVDSDSLVLSIQ